VNVALAFAPLTGMAPQAAVASVVIANDGFFQSIVFPVGDDALAVGLIKVRELLTDTALVGARDFGAAPAAGERAGDGG
jgi:hypothetical protein